MALLAMREDIGKGNVNEVSTRLACSLTMLRNKSKFRVHVFFQILAGADLSARANDSQKDEGIFSHIQIAASSLWDKLSKQN